METPKAKQKVAEYRKKLRYPNYWDWHSLRRMNNHYALIEVAEEVKKHGFNCYCCKGDYDNENISLVYAVKEKECVLFGFKEVPYEWYVYCEHYPGLTCGLVGDDTYDYPFSIEEILSKVGHNKFRKDYFDSSFFQQL